MPLLQQRGAEFGIETIVVPTEQVSLSDMTLVNVSSSLTRWLVEQGETERNAYFDAARICRGGLVSGRAPFTKDSSYLAGFMEVYNFLQVAVRGGQRESVHLLVAGRLALDDLHVLHELRARGLLAPPKLMPRWMEDWDALLPYFAFTSFLQEIDLGQVESRHRKLLQESATTGTTSQ